MLNKDQIVEAAITVWKRYSWHGVTMTRVAAALGVTHAALYHYFENVEGLKLEIAGRAIANGEPLLMAELLLLDHPAAACITQGEREVIAGRVASKDPTLLSSQADCR